MKVLSIAHLHFCRRKILEDFLIPFSFCHFGNTPIYFIDLYCLDKNSKNLDLMLILKKVLACIFKNFCLIIFIEEPDDVNNFRKASLTF